MTPDLPAAPENEPKGPSNLRLRIIWGLIAAAALFGCTFFSPITFGLFFAVVQAIMLKEFYRIMRAEGLRPASWAGGVVGVLIFGAIHLAKGYDTYTGQPALTAGWTIYPPLSAIPHASPDQSFPLLTAWALSISTPVWIGAILVLLLVLVLREIVLWPNHGKPFANVGATLAGLAYVSLPMALLNVIAFNTVASSSQVITESATVFLSKTFQFAPRHVFLLIFLIWASDTGAYIAGKTMGKHKLAPAVSPGKTWEGFAGGVLLTLAVGWVAGYFVPDISLTHRLVAAGVVAVFGPLGDLAESMLKRSAGVKDSGTFLPGHGGLLDRFDAFLLVLPVLALLQALAG